MWRITAAMRRFYAGASMTSAYRSELLESAAQAAYCRGFRPALRRRHPVNQSHPLIDTAAETVTLRPSGRNQTVALQRFVV